MIKYVINIVSLILIILSQSFAQSGTLKVQVSGYEDRTGKISIGLFNDPDGFPKRGENSTGVALDILDSTVTYTFKDLDRGEYAIAVFHDKNSNGELDRNFLGIPTEDYVFSNYATGNFGPPSFEDSKFLIEDSLNIVLELNK